MTATIFVLMVMSGTAPAYQRGTFPDYQSCVEAARGQVETLQSIEGRPVRWQCVPVSEGSGDRGQEKMRASMHHSPRACIWYPRKSKHFSQHDGTQLKKPSNIKTCYIWSGNDTCMFD